MRAGKMDRYLTIQKKTVTADSDGASVETWTTRTYVWAERRDLNTTERMQAMQVKSNISARYFTRYNSDISEKDRIVDGSDTYEIIGKPREIGRRQGLELVAGTI